MKVLHRSEQIDGQPNKGENLQDLSEENRPDRNPGENDFLGITMMKLLET